MSPVVSIASATSGWSSVDKGTTVRDDEESTTMTWTPDAGHDVATQSTQ
jgi:hypothetical protein